MARACDALRVLQDHGRVAARDHRSRCHRPPGTGTPSRPCRSSAGSGMLTCAKSPSATMAALGWSPPVKTCVTEAGKSVCSAPFAPPAIAVRLAPDLREGGQRVLHGRVRPLDLVLGQLVVLLRARLGEVDVLEPVGQRPALGAADGERGDAGVEDRLRGAEQLRPGLGLTRPRVLEDLVVVPDQGLVGGLVVDAVRLAADLADVLPALRVVLAELLDGVGAQRLGPALVDGLLDGARLRQHRDVRRLPAGHLRADEVDDRVLRGHERDLGARALLELLRGPS